MHTVGPLHPCLSGPVEFKPMLFKGQRQLKESISMQICIKDCEMMKEEKFLVVRFVCMNIRKNQSLFPSSTLTPILIKSLYRPSRGRCFQNFIYSSFSSPWASCLQRCCLSAVPQKKKNLCLQGEMPHITQVHGCVINCKMIGSELLKISSCQE